MTLFLLLFTSLVRAQTLQLSEQVSGLQSPVHVTAAPGNPSQLFVCEQAGTIAIVENGVRLETPFLNLQSKVESGGEMGLLSVAFHPRYADNGRYFVYYTALVNGKLNTVVSEFNGAGVEKRILTFPQPFANHNGGQLAFGPDGFLYIGVGDGGSAGDPQGNGQRLDTYLGKMLRIDIDRGSPYQIPPSNPLQAANQKKEIFAWGLRNPWRFSFDSLTGALFAADVGQNRLEEIDIIENGKNYGWNTMEGTKCFKPTTNCNTEGLELPIYEYDRSVGKSITGGYVYRGLRIPQLYGKYIYADYLSEKIWALNYDQVSKKVIGNELLFSETGPISSFGVQADGEILVVSHNGSIFKIVLE